MKRLRKPGDNALFTGGNLFAQGLSFIGGLIIARSLGPVGRGNVAVVAVYDEASSTALALGVPAAVGHYAAQPAAQSALAEAESRLIGAALKLAALTIPVAVVLAVVVDRWALGELPDSIRRFVMVAIVSTPVVNSVPGACRMLLVARGHLRRMTIVATIPMLARVSTYGLLLALDRLDVVAAVVVLLLSSWLSSVLAWSLTGVRPKRGGSPRQLINFGVQTIPASLAALTNSRLDQLLMVPLLTQRDLGIYAVAVGVAFVPVNVGSSLALSIYRHAALDSAQRTETTRRFRQSVYLVTASAAISAVASVGLLERVYGSDFRESVTPSLLLIAGSALTGIGLVLIQIGNAAGRPRIGSYCSLAALVVSVLGLPIALPLYGVLGAAIVSAAAYTVNGVVAYYLVRRAGLVGTLKPLRDAV